MKLGCRFFNCHTHRKPEAGDVFACRNAYHFLSENSIARLPYPVSAGIHPWHAADFSSGHTEHLRKLIRLPQVIALGEAGLDKRKGPAMDIQLSCWKAQFVLAQETGLPIIVHCVRAWEEMLPFVRNTRVPMMFHDFRGSLQLMETFAKQEGIYFSFGISLLQSAKSRLVFSHIPENRFLLETDQSALGIASVYLAAAKLRGWESSELEAQVKKNAIGFFGEKVLAFF